MGFDMKTAEYAVILYTIFIGILLTVIPYLFVLYQSFRLQIR